MPSFASKNILRIAESASASDLCFPQPSEGVAEPAWHVIWAVWLQALNGGRRLIAHHANVVVPQLHSFVLLALPSVEALRSTTSRTGMLMLQVGYHARLPTLQPPLTLQLPCVFLNVCMGYGPITADGLQ